MPSIAKIEHHHDHGRQSDNTEFPSQDYHDNCVICNFEFSVFESGKETIFFEKEEHLKYYISDYISAHFQNLSQFNFLLRAPPPFKSDLQNLLQ